MQIAMNLSQRDHNLPFSSNIERMMVANLAINSDTYFYFGQMSLEGLLKFLGSWNKNINQNSGNKQQTNSIAASISNFVTGSTANANIQASSKIILWINWLLLINWPL